ncbi:hypothetical protein [Massilia oculi]|uniref:hypothetical protein n=1 Tax=Massilia oculi TaxID=945844 RepID=UPI0028AE6C4C|nr:hypothetical protein [Massilia oculi]
MKKPVTFALSSRIKAALCCSVAVLLTACGGMANESANQQLLADTVTSETTEASSARTTAAVDIGPATPDTIAQDAAMPAAIAPAVADSAAPAMPGPAPAPADNGVATAAPVTQSADGSAPASNEFNLNGYQDAASSSDASTQGAPETAGADAQQATQLPTA